MAISVSTGLRTAMLDTGSFKSLFDGGEIRIYSGTPPADADQAVTIGGGVALLCTISLNGAGGGGLNFDTAASGGVITKAPAQTWSGTNVASGTAAWYRHVPTSATNNFSTTERRIQGTIGVAGQDLNFSSVNLTSGAVQTINHYTINLPN